MPSVSPRLHIAHEHSEQGLRALDILRKMAVPTHVIKNGSTLAGITAPLVVYFETTGKFTCKHLRIVKPGDIEKREFILPAWAAGATDVQFVALRPRSTGPNDRHFSEAIEEVYWLPNGGRPRGQGRAKRSGGHHQARSGVYATP